ncbi:DNA adenine methylase [uncultured Ruminococcus sp.]|uniref:DNA adenine methylase n=1 Tax=uncultured Ruminococcus sp. TaxID=165186 RepID=UPI00345C4C07
MESLVSFFYCDPPYFATESYYKDVGFTAKDNIRLRDALLDIKGKFLVSYNDCPEIREIWDKPNIHIEEISRLNNLVQRYDAGCQYGELLISNYDTSERAKAIKQLSLFD